MNKSVFNSIYVSIAALIAALSIASQSWAATESDLVYKAALGKAEEVQKILDSGVSPNAKDEKKVPAINIAATRGDDESIKIVEALMTKGANIDSRDEMGKTPLMEAIVSQNVKLVHFLLSKGADFYAYDVDGRSVQEQAKWIGSPEIRGLIEEALRQDSERVSKRNSKEQMYQRLDEFIYYSCASQYMAQARAIRALDDMPDDTYAEKYKKLDGIISNAQVELEYNFKMPRNELQEMSVAARNAVADEMVVYSSKKTAMRAGIGNDEDLDKRCRTILKSWRDQFAKSEARSQQQVTKAYNKEQQKEYERTMREHMESVQKQRQEAMQKRYEDYYYKSQETTKGLAVPTPQ